MWQAEPQRHRILYAGSPSIKAFLSQTRDGHQRVASVLTAKVNQYFKSKLKCIKKTLSILEIYQGESQSKYQVFMIHHILVRLSVKATSSNKDYVMKVIEMCFHRQMTQPSEFIKLNITDTKGHLFRIAEVHRRETRENSRLSTDWRTT